MWPVPVVVAAVDAEDVFEVSSAEDQDPVETLDSECAYPAFGVSVRVRRLDRRVDHPDAFAAEDLIAGAAEFRARRLCTTPAGCLRARSRRH